MAPVSWKMGVSAAETKAIRTMGSYSNPFSLAHHFCLAAVLCSAECVYFSRTRLVATSAPLILVDLCWCGRLSVFAV